ncbi:MAG: epimerase [Gemmatimonadetes bacterium 13_1_20CM_4_66_11]|nr:MAG: epimerase [Gemmatimonadetes bacterium 13_1_20CM_4_66_11]
MTRVLVTGATGFIGSSCLPRLVASGGQVHAVSSRPQGLAGPPGSSRKPDEAVRWHQADLMDPGQTARLLDAVRPTHLLHLAWAVVPGGIAPASENLRWVQASLELLRGFGERGGSRVVMAGSSYEYDWRHGYCAEAVTPTVPVNYYGRCKLALAQLLDGFAQSSGLSHAWARIFFLYGPREHPKRLVSSVIRSLLLGEPARCSHGRQIRDYLHVEDVADALVALLHSEVRGPINIGSGVPVTLRDIVSCIARKLDQAPLVQFGAVPSHPHDSPLVIADVTRLAAELKWRPRYDLDRGLDATIAWWQSELQVAAGSPT